MRHIRLTMLNSMAGDLPQSLDRHLELGFSICDLKDSLFGKVLEDLDGEEVVALDRLLRARKLDVYCLSTSLGNFNLAMGESAWLETNCAVLDRVLAAAGVLEPSVVRVIAATDTSRSQGGVGNMREEFARHPWLPGAYNRIIGRINAAGFGAVIENEVHDCIITSPDDVLTLFGALEPEQNVQFTWDVQNMWQMGTPPTVDVLRALLPWLGMLHLKGGRAGANGTLQYASGLADATWPVMEIVQTALNESDIDVICLNPSHGSSDPGYDIFSIACDDARFLRACDDRIG